MATNDPNYRDPKVTTTASSSGTSKWIAYVIGGLILLALLAWLLGLFDNDVETTSVPPTTTDETILVVPESD